MTDSDDYRQIIMQPGEPTMRIELPHHIGYVEIRTGGVNGRTGYPAISVWVNSITENSPAADGRQYKAIYCVRDDEVVLVGEPGPKMREQQRQVKWFERVIKKHDSGDHTECPEPCPAKEK